MHRDEGTQERLNQELRELSAQLSASEEKQNKLVSQLEAMLKRLQYEKEEKQTLKVGKLGFVAHVPKPPVFDCLQYTDLLHLQCLIL